MSQLDSTKTKLGDRYYAMFPMDPRKSFSLLSDVLQMVGPAIGPALDALFGKRGEGEDVMNMEVGSDFFAKLADKLFSGLKKQTLNDVIDAFTEVTEVGNAPEKTGQLKPLFAVWFRGGKNFGEMFLWIKWGLTVQWGEAFGALVADSGLRSALTAAKELQFPSTSIGSSGEL